MESEHMRYLGALGLLAECSPYVPEDVREMIALALLDAVAANPVLEFRRVLNRLELNVKIRDSDLEPIGPALSKKLGYKKA